MTTTLINPEQSPLLDASVQQVAAERASDWVAKKCPWCGHTYCLDSACIRTLTPEQLVR